MNNKIITIVIVFVVIIFTVGFLQMNNNKSTTLADSQVKTFNIEAGSFYFKPDEIRVKKGDLVKINIQSVSMMHDFYIDELNVKSPIVKDGDTGSVEFVATEVGTFEFYCSVGEHRQNGQVGKIIIE